jgi:hypothetical protein
MREEGIYRKSYLEVASLDDPDSVSLEAMEKAMLVHEAYCYVQGKKSTGMAITSLQERFVQLYDEYVKNGDTLFRGVEYGEATWVETLHALYTKSGRHEIMLDLRSDPRAKQLLQILEEFRAFERAPREFFSRMFKAIKELSGSIESTVNGTQMAYAASVGIIPFESGEEIPQIAFTVSHRGQESHLPTTRDRNYHTLNSLSKAIIYSLSIVFLLAACTAPTLNNLLSTATSGGNAQDTSIAQTTSAATQKSQPAAQTSAPTHASTGTPTSTATLDLAHLLASGGGFHVMYDNGSPDQPCLQADNPLTGYDSWTCDMTSGGQVFFEFNPQQDLSSANLATIIDGLQIAVHSINPEGIYDTSNYLLTLHLQVIDGKIGFNLPWQDIGYLQQMHFEFLFHGGLLQRSDLSLVLPPVPTATRTPTPYTPPPTEGPGSSTGVVDPTDTPEPPPDPTATPTEGGPGASATSSVSGTDGGG